ADCYSCLMKCRTSSARATASGAGFTSAFSSGSAASDSSCFKLRHMKSDTVLGISAAGFHRIHYTDWGKPDSERVVICVHGLTRNGRDFDALAEALSADFRVVCPDVAGRGRSDWLLSKDGYAYPQYCADLTTLIARVTAGGAPRKVYWVGTSMGGGIGMVLGSRPQTPIERMVVNDVGAVIPKAAIERIGAYLGKDPRVKSLAELEQLVPLGVAP